MKGEQMKTTSPDNVIEACGLTRRFGSKLALNNVSLQIPRGRVFGLVGENGSGKTTLIKHILGLLRAEGGSVRVFGFDPVADPVAVLGRIGYLSENRDLPAWMSVGELLRYTQAFYPKWDASYAEDLRRQFDLDPTAKIKNLSRGENAKAGLLIALAYRPELLLLDEPSSGLDPLVRRDILEAIIRTTAEEGRTVFFSTHLLDEVERVADDIAMMFDGQVVLKGSLDEIKESHHRLVLRFETLQSTAPKIPGALSIKGSKAEWTIVCNGKRQEAIEAATRAGGRVVAEDTPSLEEIFVARAGRAEENAESTS
jgi:ABC-2 type transport system ATP-binding protein